MVCWISVYMDVAKKLVNMTAIGVIVVLSNTCDRIIRRQHEPRVSTVSKKHVKVCFMSSVMHTQLTLADYNIPISGSTQFKYV